MILVPVTGDSKKKVVLKLDRAGKDEELVVVFAGKGRDRIELDLSAVHSAPRTKGRITVRGVLRDQATARVSGLIKIKRKAQQSEDFLEERTLLLDEKAQVEVLPYLEIEADDVRASHAATSSEMDPDQLFYLRSRGLAPAEAAHLLVSGFLAQAIAADPAKKLGSKLEKVIDYALD